MTDNEFIAYKVGMEIASESLIAQIKERMSTQTDKEIAYKLWMIIKDSIKIIRDDREFAEMCFDSADSVLND